MGPEQDRVSVATLRDGRRPAAGAAGEELPVSQRMDAARLARVEEEVKKPTILIADDEPHMRAAMKKRLTAWGYSVVESHDGLSVLSQCPKGWVDLVILDQEMPNGDGRSVARVIRNETDIPILFISGHDPEEFRSVVTSLPDIYYLPKPVDDQKLATLLATLLPTQTDSRRQPASVI